MKRHKHKSSKKNYFSIVIAIVIVIILATIIFSGNDEPVVDDLTEQEQNQDQAILEDATEPTLEPVAVIKEEVAVITSKKVGEEGLCEDYFFEQGDELKILSHSIVLNRISNGALRIQVDGENYVLAEGDSELAGDGIKISLARGKILYFALDDVSNSAMIRVGCDYDDNPNEKYVQNRGEDICQEVYENCQDSFGIELE